MIKNKYKISNNYFFSLHPMRCSNFFLIQAGEALCAKDTVVAEHQQTYFEITYVSDGKGVSYLNNTAIEIHKNDCFFSFPGETHKIVSDEQHPLRFIFLAFYAKEKTQANTLMHFIEKNCQSADKRKHCIENLAPILIKIVQELRNEDIYTKRIIGSYLEETLIECCRTISKTTKSIPQNVLTDDAVLTHDVITYIDNNIFKIKKLADLESVFFYNVTKIAKAFHSQTGIPLCKYFINKKMETAVQMLEAGENITQVSDKLQYSSIHAFSRAYKNYFNEPPSASQKKRNN